MSFCYWEPQGNQLTWHTQRLMLACAVFEHIQTKADYPNKNLVCSSRTGQLQLVKLGALWAWNVTIAAGSSLVRQPRQTVKPESFISPGLHFNSLGAKRRVPTVTARLLAAAVSRPARVRGPASFLRSYIRELIVVIRLFLYPTFITCCYGQSPVLDTLFMYNKWV